MNWGELEWYEYAATGVLMAGPVFALGLIGYMAYKCSPLAKETYQEFADKREIRVRQEKEAELERERKAAIQRKKYLELAPILKANAEQLLEDILNEDPAYQSRSAARKVEQRYLAPQDHPLLQQLLF